MRVRRLVLGGMESGLSRDGDHDHDRDRDRGRDCCDKVTNEAIANHDESKPARPQQHRGAPPKTTKNK